MTRKILAVGIILFLSSACLPHSGSLAEKTNTIPSSTREKASILTQQELEKPPSPEWSPSPEESAPAYSSPSTENQIVWSLDLPISDESNEDFSFEVLPKGRSKQVSEFDIPIVINAKVEQFIKHFQTTGRRVFTSWLARSEKYIPFMKNLLKENGLPEDLVYMAFIESGFNSYAHSRSKA